MRFRTYDATPGFTQDYGAVREYLVKLNNNNYPFGRWDWMITHGYLDASGLCKIGIWQEEDDIAALATYDCTLGKAYLCCLPRHRGLLREMLLYAADHLGKDGEAMISIRDGDEELQSIAASEGFIPTQEKECDAVYSIGDPAAITYSLPEGFEVVSMAQAYDYRKYRKCLWRGFNHEGELELSDEEVQQGEAEFIRPNVNLDIKIAVMAPNGDFVSYCGMWQDPGTDVALVEPVATDPAYRMMGLGRAAVLEGVKRCGQLGAKRALVGSSQQFYYSIGFRPCQTSTFWKRK